MQDPNADTQWNDALRRHGILPQKEKEFTEDDIVDIVENTVQEKLQAEEVCDDKKPLDELTLDELDLCEDDEDERILLAYRKKRLAELKELMSREMYGDVREISASDYVEQVNNAGAGVWVILHVYKQGIQLCTMINNYINQLARKYPAVKFLKSVSDTCIANYPERNLPTIFIYYEGQLKEKFIGSEALGNTNLKADVLEWMLSETGAFETDLEEDPRKKVKDVLMSSLRASNSEADDW